MLNIRVITTSAIFMLCPIHCYGATLPIDFVTVSDASNIADNNGIGSVNYDYRISKYEITNRQYAAFLSAVGTRGLYDSRMTTDSLSYGIQIGGGAIPGREDAPIVWVSFLDAMRFANWMHNGQPSGTQNQSTTEDGAYTLTPEAINSNSITRNSDAKFFLPNLDEWYKAAYYKGGGKYSGYWDFATQNDTLPIRDVPPGGTNSANFGGTSGGGPATWNVGSYPMSNGSYGTYDQTGNVWEWTEAVDTENSSLRKIIGGSWANADPSLLEASSGFGLLPSNQSNSVGFRIASVIPEPSSMSLIAFVCIAFLCIRRSSCCYQVWRSTL